MSKPDPKQQLADILVRGAGRVVCETLEKRTVIARYNPEMARNDAQGKLDGRTIITGLALYGASKIAARSAAGVALVAGGFALKALYDRGKARHQVEPGEETAAE